MNPFEQFPKEESDLMRDSGDRSKGGYSASTCSAPFEVAPHMLQFRCDDAGRLIAAALNRFHETGELDRYLEQNAKDLT